MSLFLVRIENDGVDLKSHYSDSYHNASSGVCQNVLLSSRVYLVETVHSKKRPKDRKAAKIQSLIRAKNTTTIS